MTMVMEPIAHKMQDLELPGPAVDAESYIAESSFCTTPEFETVSLEIGLADEVLTVLGMGGTAKQINPGECASGTYLVATDGHPVAVVKPQDEEPGMKYNARYSEQEKEGFAPGEGYKRELFASLIGRYAGVPETTTMNVPEAVFGRDGGATVPASVQRYVENDGESWDSGPAKFCAADVRRIGMLDIRLLNCDRHGGNILIHRDARDATVRLTPIDHGYTLPTSVADLDFEWITWSQAKTAFSAEDMEYIRSIDLEHECAILRDLEVEPAAIDLFVASTLALEAGAAAGMTVYDLAMFCRRETLDRSSGFEDLVARCMVDGAMDFTAYEELLPGALAGARRV